MMDWADSGWSWWWMLPMMTLMVMLVVAVIWTLVTLTRPSNTSSPPSGRTSEDLLNERFARGEIDVAEYRERSDALHGAAKRT